jgi:O-antigen/teichoic acid export membrane protein
LKFFMSRYSISGLYQRLRGYSQASDLRAQIMRGGFYSAVIQAVNLILVLALGIILARALGTEGYGVYAYAFAIMNVLMIVAEAGVPTLLMREVAASLGRQEWGVLRGAIVRAGQWVAFSSTLVSLIGLSVLWVAGDGLDHAGRYTALFMLLALPLVSMARTVDHGMRGLHYVTAAQIVDTLRPLLVVLAVGVVFSALPYLRQPQYAMSAQLGAAAMSLFAGVWVLSRKLPGEVRNHSAEFHTRKWLKNSLSFILIGGAGVINNQADIIMLGWFRTMDEVGVYRVAVQGATLVAFGLQAANAVIAPHFARLYAQGDMLRLQRLVTASARLILLSALPFALAFIVAGGAIAAWVFGADFRQSHTPLAILSAGQLVNAAFGSVGFLLNMTGHEKDTALVLWLTVMLNILLNLMLIPSFGVAGAGSATAISLVTWNVLLFFVVRRRIRLNSTAFTFQGP